VKEIQLTRGQVVLVDDDIFEELNRFKWYAHKDGKTFYAIRNLPRINGRQHKIRMHHVVAGFPPEGLMMDHCDGNGLNNQRKNLKHVTSRQNSQNRQNLTQQSSQYSGVCWHKGNKKWVAQIRVNDKRKCLGYFISELDAFNVYCNVVKSLGQKVIKN
jgi:hypothetical protein